MVTFTKRKSILNEGEVVGMYEVKDGLGWSIVKGKAVVLEVTSKHYAVYLCNQLNNGVTLDDINKREYPDKEYFAYCRKEQQNLLSAY